MMVLDKYIQSLPLLHNISRLLRDGGGVVFVGPDKVDESSSLVND
jgi:hypothetical protein